MSHNEYQDYIEREVDILIDAREGNVGNKWPSSSTTSLRIKAKIIGETDKFLELEDVVQLHTGPTGHVSKSVASESYKEAAINKDYIIGVFVK